MLTDSEHSLQVLYSGENKADEKLCLTSSCICLHENDALARSLSLRVGGKDPKVLATAAVTQLAGGGGGGGSGVDGSTQLSVREVKEKREGERGERARGVRPRLGSMLTFFLVTTSERPFDKVEGEPFTSCL